MGRLVAVAAVLLVACGATAHAQTLTLAFHQGDTYGYGLHLVLKTQLTGAVSTPIDLELTAKEAVSVVSVDASGNADVSITTSDVTMKESMGTTTTTTTGLSGQTVTMTVTPDGRVLDVNGQPFASMGLSTLGGTAGSFVSAILPSSAVKPGDAWSKTYDIPNSSGTGGVHVVADSTYLRNETVGGLSTAVVETKGTATINLTIDLGKMLGGTGPLPGMMGGGTPGPATPAPGQGPQGMDITGTGRSDTTSWIDPSGHRVVKTHQTAGIQAKLTFQLSAGPTAPSIMPTTVDVTEALDLTPA